MNLLENHIYLVSLQSFSYHAEGYVANEVGTIPLKAFKEENAAKNFALNFFQKQFVQDIESILEVLTNEKMNEKDYLLIQELAEIQLNKYFQKMRNSQHSYYQLTDNPKLCAEFKKQLIKICSEVDLDKGQRLYRTIVGKDLMHIEKIEFN